MTDGSPVRADAARHQPSRWLVLLAVSPDLIGPVVAVYGALAVLGMLLGAPGSGAVALSLAGAAVTAWVLTRRLAPHAPTHRAGALAASGAWLLAIGWTALNVLVAGEHFIVDRDPGFYATTGRYLADHDSIPLSTGAGALVETVPGLTTAGAGYYTAGPGEVYSQGGPLLPVVLGHLQRVLGASALTWGNVLLGGLALLAFYAWCRRFLRGYWALLPPAALAVSLPFLYVARATYSEVLALTLVTGGLALLTVGLTRVVPWVSGLGAATMTASLLGRIDGVAIAGLVVVATVGIWVLTSGARADQVRRTALVTLAAVLAVALSGWWVYYRYTPLYLGDLWVQFAQSMIGLLVGGLVVTIVAAAWPWVVPHLGHRRRGLGLLVGRGLALLSALALVYLTARPLWSEPHAPLDPTSGYQTFVAGVQEANGVAVDPSRTYDEFPVVSTAWYFGWATLALAIAGLLLFAARGRHRALPRWAPVLGAVVAQIPLYFAAWHITPDQLWASRRLVGLGYPLLLVLAAYAAAAVTRGLARRARGNAVPVLRGAASAVLVVAVLGWTVLVTRPLATVSDYRGFGTLVSETCDGLDRLTRSGQVPAVAVLTGRLRGQFVRTVGVFCDIPSVVSAVGVATPADDEATVRRVGAWARANGVLAVQVDIRPEGKGSPSSGQHLERAVPMTTKTLTHAPSTWAWYRYLVTVTPVD